MKDVNKLQRDIERELKHDNLRRAKKLRHRANKLIYASTPKLRVQGIDWKPDVEYSRDLF